MKRVIGKISPDEKNVSIWGAGFAGLVLGYYLKNEGYRVTIHEKSNKLGGKIQTKKIAGSYVEKGPNALYINADVLELLKDLKLEPLPATKKLKRLLMINGKPKRPFQFSMLSKMGLKLGKKPPLITDGLSVAEFFRPVLGQENIKRFISPALSGIYASNAEQLHFKSVFNEVGSKAQFESYWEFLKYQLKLKKAQPKLELTGSVSFEAGMQTLINRLGEVLKNDIKLNSKEPVRLKGNTIICTDALSAAGLLENVRPDFSAELSRIRYQELCSVTVLLKRDLRPLQRSFGVLIPENTGFHSIGILNNKAIFPINSENLLSFTFISKKKMTEEQVLQDIKLLTPDFDPQDVEHFDFNHYDKALPIYDLQRYLSVKKLHQLALKEDHLALFGNYVAGISLREMITAAKTFAKDPQQYQKKV
jgi:oxygen-dependent protoporphyrinogen oxidase